MVIKSIVFTVVGVIPFFDLLLDPQILLSITSIPDITMTSDVISAGLYAIEGDIDSATNVIMWSAGGLGAGPLFSMLSRFWKELGKNEKQIKMMTEVIEETISKRKSAPDFHPGHHPEIFKKSEYGRQPTYVLDIKGRLRETSLVDEAHNLVQMKKILPNHVPDVIGFGGKRGERFLELSKIDSPEHFDLFSNKYFKKAIEKEIDGADIDDLIGVKGQLEKIMGKFQKAGLEHGDLNPGNIIVDSKRNVWIIDPIGLRSGEKITAGMIDDTWYFEEYIDSIDTIIKMSK